MPTTRNDDRRAWPARSGTTTPSATGSSSAPRPRAALSPRLLDPRARLPRPGAGRRQTAGRQPGVQHRPPTLVRDPRRQRGSRHDRAAARRAAVLRLGRPHPRYARGRLQPARLPHRNDLAARELADRRRPRPLRTSRGGSHDRRLDPRRGPVLRAPPARGVRRLPGRSDLRSRRIPHGIASPGMGRRSPATAAEHAPWPATRGHGRRGRPSRPQWARLDPTRPRPRPTADGTRDTLTTALGSAGYRGLVGADDREIMRLALPALGALAAGPLYTLVDTAIVGHLGARPLAGLALAGTALAAVIEVADFLSYGVTSQIARLQRRRRARARAGGGGAGTVAGAGDGGDRGGTAARRSADRCWRWSGTAPACAGAPGVPVDRPRRRPGPAGRARRRRMPARARRPAQPAADPRRSPTAPTSRSRSCSSTACTWGWPGSALGTLIAQLGMGLAFARSMLAIAGADRRPRLERMRPMLRTGGHLTRADGGAARRVHAVLGARRPDGHGGARRPTRSRSSCSSSSRSCSTRSRSPGRS